MEFRSPKELIPREDNRFLLEMLVNDFPEVKGESVGSNFLFSDLRKNDVAIGDQPSILDGTPLRSLLRRVFWWRQAMIEEGGTQRLLLGDGGSDGSGQEIYRVVQVHCLCLDRNKESKNEN
jgi:hypothetical protein